MQPLVTIVMLTYNADEKIYEAIDSVFMQNYSNIELIVSDDCSSYFEEENIVKYIVEKKCKNVRKWIVRKNGTNIGTVKHENLVYGLVSGEYIIELASDDVFYDSNVVEKIVDKMKTNNLDILATRRLVCDNNLKPQHFWPHIKEKKRVEKLNTPYKQHTALITNRFYDMVSGSAIAFRKSIFEYLKYDENYILVEDFPFFTNYSWNNIIHYSHDIVSIKYRLGGCSNTINPKVKADMNYYNEVDRVKHFKELDKKNQRRVQYILERYKTSNKTQQIKLYFKYLDILIEKIHYNFFRKICKLYDQLYILIKG